MNAASDTLLALLLALNNLEPPMSAEDNAKLFEIGEQLELDPDDWEFIREGLMAIIANNPQLEQQFQMSLNQLATLEEEMKPQLSPTEKEITQAFDRSSSWEIRGEDKAEVKTEAIVKIAIKVLKDDQPTKTTKTLNWIKRVDKLVQPDS